VVVVHGWVYGLHNGWLADLGFTVSAAEEVAPAYERALALLQQRWRERAGPPPAD
jgi:carbonic anhydrase